MPQLLTILISFIAAALAMAFYTLLERKLLGYSQTRKGPNKVGLAGLPQPFADAMKLFLKEMSRPTLANTIPFMVAPCMSLFLAIILWSLYPHVFPASFFSFGILFFLVMSSLNVYTTLAAGWSSNSKYSLLGALRGVAQTISYEVSMVLILLSALMALSTLNMSFMLFSRHIPLLILLLPICVIWFITALAETARTPFDFAEGESELVSGFNTEYSSGTFALIFMAEYINILFLSLISALLFLQPLAPQILSPTILALKTMAFATLFIWVRASYPRMRYDRLMALTWKVFLPFALMSVLMIISASLLP